MSLTTSQRFGAYFFGFGVGCVLVTVFVAIRGMPKGAEAQSPGVIRREVPPGVSMWVEKGDPIEGDYVISHEDNRLTGGADKTNGTFVRSLVVEGLDAGAFIRIEEKSSFKTPDRIDGWQFMMADSVRAKLLPGADTSAVANAMKSYGWRFVGMKDAGGWVTVALNNHEVKSVPLAVSQLKSWTQWIADATPDNLPPPQPGPPK